VCGERLLRPSTLKAAISVEEDRMYKIALGTLALLAAAAIVLFVSWPRASSVDEAAQKRAIAISNEPRFLPPPGWTWGSLVNADGAHLRYGWTDPVKPIRGVIIVAPSFQAPAEEYFETARDLSRDGFAVWILDRRGQGGSDRWPGAEKRAHLEGAWREVRDLRQFTVSTLARYPHVPGILLGESFGGLVGLRLLHDYPGLFTAAVFSSPGIDFQTNGVPRGLLRVLVTSACKLGWCKDYAPTQNDWAFDANPGTASDPVRDDPDRAFAEEGVLLTRPQLREGGATNGWVTALFEEADIEEAAGWPEAIKTAVLFGFTPKDRIARPDVMQSVCHRMPHCTLAKFTSTGHALFTDADSTRAPWMRELETFLTQASNRT
jgi:lysophospholipase